MRCCCRISISSLAHWIIFFYRATLISLLGALTADECNSGRGWLCCMLIVVKRKILLIWPPYLKWAKPSCECECGANVARALGILSLRALSLALALHNGTNIRTSEKKIVGNKNWGWFWDEALATTLSVRACVFVCVCALAPLLKVSSSPPPTRGCSSPAHHHTTHQSESV